MEKDSNNKPFFREKGKHLSKDEHSGFVERLMKLRMAAGISQETLSQKIGLSKSTYGTYEIEKALPDAETVRNLALYYRVPADYLLGLTDEMGVEYNLEDGEDERDLVMRQFSLKCRQQLAEVVYEDEPRLLFENLLCEKEFVTFLKYVHTYVKYSARVNKDYFPKLKEFGCYDEVYSVDPTDNSLTRTGNCVSKLEIADVYYAMLHQTLDRMMTNLTKDEKYINKMETVIREIFSQNMRQHQENICESE